MARPQSPILARHDPSNYRAVVMWVSRRFDESVRANRYVMSRQTGELLDRGENSDPAHQADRDSWRELEKMWTTGWDLLYVDKLPEPEAYFDDLVGKTNAWLDDHFPAGRGDGGVERKRLLAAVRQQILRNKRVGDPVIQITISGPLYKDLDRKTGYCASESHDLVRAALQLVLESPDLLAKAKERIVASAPAMS